MALGVAAGVQAWYASEQEKDRLRIELRSSRVTERVVNAMLDSNNICYVILNRQGKIVEWNNGIAKLTGYTREEMLGNTLRPVMRPEDHEKHLKGLVAKFEALENNPEHLDGDLIPLECTMIGKNEQIIATEIIARLVWVKDYEEAYAISHIDPKEEETKAAMLLSFPF